MKIQCSKSITFLRCLLLGSAIWLTRPAVSRCDVLSTPTPITIDEASNSIRVDGHLGDWPSARMILLNNKSQLTLGRVNWKNKDQFNGRVFITYDPDYLYVSAIVKKDSTAVNNNGKLSLWDGDCVELFIAADTSKAGSMRGISRGDYHIGFSPGTNCADPTMYCFNKEKEIGGGRIIAKRAGHGYILEACVPLAFFEGLEIAPGKTTRFNLAIDSGGSISGKRMFQLDVTGNPLSWENPSLWPTLEWIGKTVKVSIPKNDEENLYANLVSDGTKGMTFWGRRDVSGIVLDGNGKPLSGAMISTWPRTSPLTTGPDGRFEFQKIKTYDGTVVYARVDGYASSLVGIQRKNGSVTIRLKSLPAPFTSFDAMTSPFFYGQSFQVPDAGDLSSLMGSVRDRVSVLRLNILKLVGADLPGPAREKWRQNLDDFVSYTRGLGAEPMIELPIERTDPQKAAEWVRYCNLEKKYNIQYWTIGDEPDLYSEKKLDPQFTAYNVYDYINDFRAIYNEVKRADPSVLILGPELAWRYTQGEDDWLTPFIQYDGDIVNLVSIHHYAAVKAAQCAPQAVMDDVRHETIVLRNLRDKISGNSDVLLPLVVTGGNVCAESTDNTVTAKASTVPPVLTPSTDTSKKKSKSRALASAKRQGEDAGPGSFWAGLWEADIAGVFLREKVGMGFFSCLKGNGPLDFFSAEGPRAVYWALHMISAQMRGQVVWAQVKNGDVSAYAVQDPATKDLTLLIINKGDDYYHPKILLNGKDSDVTVDAGLDQKFDYEVPYYSISILKIKADKSGDEAILYTKEMALAGKTPQVSAIKPW